MTAVEIKYLFLQAVDPMQAIAVSCFNSFWINLGWIFLFALCNVLFAFSLWEVFWEYECINHILQTVSCYASGETFESLWGDTESSVDLHQIPSGQYHQSALHTCGLKQLSDWYLTLFCRLFPMWPCSSSCCFLYMLWLECRYLHTHHPLLIIIPWPPMENFQFWLTERCGLMCCNQGQQQWGWAKDHHEVVCVTTNNLKT